MKLLTNKKYRDFKSQIEDAEDAEGDLRICFRELMRYKKFAQTISKTFSVKRAVVGAKASGKSYFIKTEILPNVLNYFIIDMTSEYINIPQKNKYVYDINIRHKENEEKILKAIKKNKNKLIIVEDALRLGLPFFRRLMSETRDMNFIIVLQSKKVLETWLGCINVIYDFGTLDYFSEKITDTPVVIKK